MLPPVFLILARFWSESVPLIKQYFSSRYR